MTDVPFGVLLSGGLDSSLVASVASRYLAGSTAAQWGSQLHTFCVGLKVVTMSSAHVSLFSPGHFWNNMLLHEPESLLFYFKSSLENSFHLKSTLVRLQYLLVQK